VWPAKPKPDPELLSLFEESARNVQRSALLLRDLLTNYPEQAGLAREILLCEQEGDRIAHDILHRLAGNGHRRAALDAADVHALVGALDDIVDFAEEAADQLGRLAPTRWPNRCVLPPRCHPDRGGTMRRGATITILALSAAAVASTSAEGTPSTRAAATTLKLRAAADGANRFSKERLRAEPGKVTIRLRNPSTSGKPHAVEIEGHGVEKESAVAGPGHRVSVTAKLRRGTYEFYCPVDGHKAAGMEGKLVVK